VKLLAVETSSIACSVALQDEEKIFARHIVEEKAHTRILLPMINELLDEAQCRFEDLNALVLGNGPGSFIGMRIGASVVQGLAFSLGLNIVAVSSLAAVAAEVLSLQEVDRVAVAQDARMNEVYLGCFERSDAGLPLRCSKEQLQAIGRIDMLAESDGGWTSAGSGWQRYPELMKSNDAYLSAGSDVTLPRASHLFGLAQAILRAGGDIAPQLLQPAYLRSQVATPPQERAS
jgi:tRNA threonylcarbamoyladenosine biosynthesis protein TsaB